MATTENPVAADESAEDVGVTLDELFAQIDSGGDGSINFREFAEWWARRQMLKKGAVEEDILAKAWELFEKHDRDHDQQIDQPEFEAVLDDLAQSEWKQAEDPGTGRSYWANPKTRESTWVQPSIKEFLKRAGVATLLKREGKKYNAQAANTNASGDQMTMLLNMWSLYLRFNRKETSRFYTDFFTYIAYILLMVALMSNMLPISTSFLKHQEALEDYLLDEEFEGVANHKKSWFDVMTEEELWQWMEEPLYGAFYDGASAGSSCDDPAPCSLDGQGPEGPQLAKCHNNYTACEADMPYPLLHTNDLLGRMQIRSLRVGAQKCADVGWRRNVRYDDSSPKFREDCATKGGVWTEQRTGVPYSTCLEPSNTIKNCAGAWNGPYRDATPAYYRDLQMREANYRENRGGGEGFNRIEPGEPCGKHPEECRSGHCSTGGVCTAYDDPAQLDWWNVWGPSYLANCDENGICDGDAEIDGLPPMPAGTQDATADDIAGAEALIKRMAENVNGTSSEKGSGQSRGHSTVPTRHMSTLGYSALTGSNRLVPNLYGFTGMADHKYGDFGYAVTLPRDRHGWRATVCKLQGKLETCRSEDDGNTTGSGACFVKTWRDQVNMHLDPGWSGLSTTPAECPDELEPGACMCVDDPNGVPFIDKYTRMFSISLALHNANDFDIDDPSYGDEPSANDKTDDHYVAFQLSIAIGPGGHLEKYDRISIVRPMRVFGYLDSPIFKGFGVAWGFTVFLLLMKELQAIRKAGIRSHYFRSAKAVWNIYEFVFYICVLRAVRDTLAFTQYTADIEQELQELHAAGLLQHTFVDLVQMKKEFRDCLKACGMVVFISIFKIFKYLSLSLKLNFMWRIILKAKTEILAFLVIFVLFLAGSGYLASILFGYELRLFHNWASAIMSLFRLSVGALDFDYDKLKMADGFFTPIFMAGYIFAGMLVMINMFIAILSEYYSVVKAEIEHWDEDVEIFKQQGFSVPTNALFDKVMSVKNYFHMRSQLLMEPEPPNLPVRVLPVLKITSRHHGKCTDFGDGGNFLTKNLASIAMASIMAIAYATHALLIGTAKDAFISQNIWLVLWFIVALLVTCCLNVAHVCKKAEIKVRPVKWTAVYRERLQQLVQEFEMSDGPNEHPDASNLVRLHYYSEFVPDELKDASKRQRNIPIKGVIEHTETGPQLRSADSFMKGDDDSPMNHMIMTLGRTQSAEDDADDYRTVVCLRLHNDDMYSEVRPQVLSKMKARFPPKTEGEATEDAPFGPENLTPDTVTLSEDVFGCKLEMELLCHEVTNNHENSVFGEQKDMFALFRVIEISSSEHFDGKPTPLQVAKGGWEPVQDRIMWDMLNGRIANQPNSAMAEKFDKTMREVELRQRFLERQCKDVDGYPITPKLLTVCFEPSWDVAYQMWVKALKDTSMGAVSLGYFGSRLGSVFRCNRYKDPVIRDMKKFLRTRVQEVRDSSNINDLPELERTFLQENMTLDDAIAKMRVFCVNSGRHNAQAMERLYGRPGEEKLVAEKYGEDEDDPTTQKIDVRQKIKNWLIRKHSSSINVIVVKGMDSDSESESDDERYM